MHALTYHAPCVSRIVQRMFQAFHDRVPQLPFRFHTSWLALPPKPPPPPHCQKRTHSRSTNPSSPRASRSPSGMRIPSSCLSVRSLGFLASKGVLFGGPPHLFPAGTVWCGVLSLPFAGDSLTASPSSPENLTQTRSLVECWFPHSISKTPMHRGGRKNRVKRVFRNVRHASRPQDRVVVHVGGRSCAKPAIRHHHHPTSSSSSSSSLASS